MAQAPEQLDAPTTPSIGPGRMSVLAGSAATWRAVLLVIPLGLGVLLFAYYANTFIGVDFDVYRGGGGTVLAGKPLYAFLSWEGYPFTYPPIAAVVFVPLALLPAAVALGVWSFLSVLALEVVVWLTLGRLGVTDPVTRLRRSAIYTVLALPLGTVVFNLWVGQINIILLLLVFADRFARTGRFRGALIGVAAGIKLTPLIFIPYLLFTRRFREAVTATVAFAGTVLIGFAVTPRDAGTYWQQYVFDVSRITQDRHVFANSSLRGLLVRLHVPGLTVVSLVVSVVVAVLGLALAVWASRRGQELIGVMACGLTGLLVSPVSWVVHWVWVVPLLMMWTVRASRRDMTGEKIGLAVVWLACASSLWWVTMQMRLLPIPDPANHFFANLYLVVGVGALIAFAVYLRRTAPAKAPEPLP
jgi:alpha-1,2-mannosyltransferase